MATRTKGYVQRGESSSSRQETAICDRDGSCKMGRTRRSRSSFDGRAIPVVGEHASSSRGPFHRSSSVSAAAGSSKLGAASQLDRRVEQTHLSFQLPKRNILLAPAALYKGLMRRRSKTKGYVDSEKPTIGNFNMRFGGEVLPPEDEEKEEDFYSETDLETSETEEELYTRHKTGKSSCHCHQSNDTDYNNGFEANSRTHYRLKCKRSRCLGDKYEPQHFEDVVGQEINVKTLSRAIQKQKIAPLYLFYGPGGTGKSCTAKIFAMAAQCESPWPYKPCWNCKGCSKSLCVNQLFSRCNSFSFNQILAPVHGATLSNHSGIMVFIIEECYLFHSKDWEELLAIVEREKGCRMIAFIIVAEDPSRLPQSVSAKCQKFSFQKLKEADITFKLTKIIAREGLKIEKDALCLITRKAQGSLREAESILDQLALLGLRVTPPVVRQLVGLVEQEQLIGLLETAISTDAVSTARYTRELLATGIKPQALVTQLGYLVTDILSYKDTSTLSNNKSSLEVLNSQSTSWLCQALKLLTETEKHLQSCASSNQATTWVVAALLQIAAYDSCSSTDIIASQEVMTLDGSPLMSASGSTWNSMHIHQMGHSNHAIHSKSQTKQHHKFARSSYRANNEDMPMDRIDGSNECPEVNPYFTKFRDMEKVWKDIIARIDSPDIKDFLDQRGQLVSLTVCRANAIVHLVFTCLQDKLMAEVSQETISKAVGTAFGCPVTVNISFQQAELKIAEIISPRETEGTEIRNNSYSACQSTLLPSYAGLDMNEITASCITDRNQLEQSDPTCQRTPWHPICEQPFNSRERQSVMEQNTSQTLNHSSLRSNLKYPGLYDRADIFQGHQCQQNRSSIGTCTQGSTGESAQHPGDPSARNKSCRNIETFITKSTPVKESFFSFPSIQNQDGSIEPYSWDLLFEKANCHRGKRRGLKDCWRCNNRCC